MNIFKQWLIILEIEPILKNISFNSNYTKKFGDL